MIKPQAMKVKCIKCLATTIIMPKSDAVIMPCCKKCGGQCYFSSGYKYAIEEI